MSLIQRLQEVTEPTEGLRDEVLLAVGWTQSEEFRGEWSPPGTPWIACKNPPNPLTDLNAAVALVPEGWVWQVGPFNCKRIAVAELAELADDIQGFGPGIKCRARAEHRIPATALTIAALQTLSSQKEVTP